VGARPPQMGFLFRPPVPEHHSLAHIRARGAFAFHVMAGDADLALRVHQCAARYPAGVSELEATGFAWERWDEVDAPIVGEALVQIGLTSAEEHVLGQGTVLVVGDIRRVEAPRLAPGPDGYWPLAEAGALTTNGLDAYHHAVALVRAAYPHSDTPPRRLDP
jgi:flavin reductase (DIM6/NTAB) family NADH-FMN oxidoreductase RutF